MINYGGCEYLGKVQYTGILYLIASFSAFPAIIGIAVMFIIFPFYVLTKRIRISRKLPNYIAIAFIISLSIWHLFFNLEFFNGGLVLNLIFLMCIVLLVKEREFNLSSFITLIKVLTILNTILIFSYFIPNLRDIFYFELLGFYRFQGMYLEPSIAAIFSMFNIIVLLSHSKKNKNYLYIFISLLIVILTFSGSGLFLMLTILFFYLIKNIKASILFFSFCFLLSVYYLIFLGFQDNPIYMRIMNILDGNFSQSTYMRFFAPVEFINYLYHANISSFLFGVSDPRLFIELNHSDFKYFYLWHGSPTYDLNNGYAVLWSLSGLIGLGTFFTYMFYFWKNKNFLLNVFVLLVPFFTGHFVSIIYWFYIFIFIEFNRRNFLSTK